MSGKLPYVVQPGLIVKILNKIKEAQTPDRFTYDFLENKLGFRGGNYKQFVSLAKKIGFLSSDGKPTDLYKKFRNELTSGAAMAEAIKIGYREVFERSEYADNLDKEKFKGLVVEITGLEQKNQVVKLVCNTFDNLKSFANFEKKLDSIKDSDLKSKIDSQEAINGISKDFDLNLSYTVNLVLPKTDDPAVFNAIFRSLKENLLKK